jgi:hypothetical protein
MSQEALLEDVVKATQAMLLQPKMHVYCEEEEAYPKERNCDHDVNGGCRGNFKGLD